MLPTNPAKLLNTMIFPAGQHHGQDAILAILLANLRPPKSRCSINMPWAIPHWLALVEFLGLTAKEYNEHDDDKVTILTMTAMTATVTATSPTTRMTATKVTATKVKWMGTVAVMMTTSMMTSSMTTTTVMGRQQWDGDNNDGRTTM
jgi:hypothetical protein